MKAQSTIKNIERKIAENRTYRKYFMQPETQTLLEYAEELADTVWSSEYGTIWLTRYNQPGFTTEANPKLFWALEVIDDFLNRHYKDVVMSSQDFLENYQRVYDFSFHWRGQNFSVKLICELAQDTEACIRVQTGSKTSQCITAIFLFERWAWMHAYRDTMPVGERINNETARRSACDDRRRTRGWSPSGPGPSACACTR